MLLRLKNEFHDRGLSVMAVLFRDTPENAFEWLTTRDDGTLPTLIDSSGRVARAYRVGGIPQTVLVDADQRITRTMVG